MPLLLLIPSFSSIGCGSSALIVEVDVDRPRGFFNGPRWVSLNSTYRLTESVQLEDRLGLLFVRFQDILKERMYQDGMSDWRLNRGGRARAGVVLLNAEN